MATENIELLHIGPSSTTRTSLVYLTRGYAAALAAGGASDSAMPALDVDELLNDHFEENPDAIESLGTSRIRSVMLSALERHSQSSRQIIHAEISRDTLREFWALHHAVRSRPGCPYCITFHDPPHFPVIINPMTRLHSKAGFFERLITNLAGWIAALSRRRIEQSLVQGAAALLAMSERGAALLASTYPHLAHKVHVIPPFSLGKGPDGSEPPKRTLPGRIQITYLDYFKSTAGFEQINAAMTQLARRLRLHETVHLRIRGRLPDRGARMHIRDRMRNLFSSGLRSIADINLGELSEAQIDDLMNDTDILLLPYLSGECEDCSKTLMRAQNWAVAPIAAGTGCVLQWIEPDREGIVYPPGDVKALADAIERLLVNPDQRIEMAAAFRARAQRERSTDGMVQQMTSLYEDILTAHAPTSPPSASARGAGRESRRAP